MKEIRIASYMRLSREDKETEESQSIINQRGIIDAYLKAVPEFSATKVSEYIDDGYSGMTTDRPALQELLKKVQVGSINVIIVKDFSRFTRNYMEQGHYLEVVFPSAGVRFISVNDCYDSNGVSKLSDKFHIAIPGMVNHLYSQDLSVKVKTAKRSLIKAGKMCSSRVPYGYKKDKTGETPYIIEEETADVVRSIFAMAVDEEKIIAIAKKLNNQNILSPGAYKAQQGLGKYGNEKGEANPWEYSAIRSILDDERYIGTLVLGKSETKIPGNPNGSRLPKEKWFRFPDSFEPIVDKEIFCQVQDIKKKTSAKTKKDRNLHVLHKKVKCKSCGRFMKYKNDSYYCNTPRLMDGTNCFVGYVKEALILDAVFLVLKTYIQLWESYSQFVKIYSKKKQIRNRDIPHCLAELDKQCNDLVIKKGKLYEEYKHGKLSQKDYISNKEQAQKQVDVLEMKKELLKTEQATNSMIKSQFMKSILPFTKEEFLTSEMAEALVDMVYVEDRKHIKIKLKYEDCYLPAKEFMEKYCDNTSS